MLSGKHIGGASCRQATVAAIAFYMEVRFWYDETDGAIHMTAPDVPNFHVAVAGDPESRRGHPSLFKVLTQCLHEKGALAPSQETPDA